MTGRSEQTSSGVSERLALADSAFERLSNDITRSTDELSRLVLPGYTLLTQLDSGGQGIVYTARQEGTGRIVAIKFLIDGPLASSAQRARFEREIRLISRIRHPGVVAVFDCGEVAGRLFYVMEFVGGLAIDDHTILRDLPPHAIVELITKVARALEQTHRIGVIHRDLKPGNILVDDEGQPRVCDFGLAKDLRDDDLTGLSEATPVVGTLPFTAPEQLDPTNSIPDVRTDVYSLAMVLYFLLTDAFPYPIDRDKAALCRAILTAAPVRVTDSIRRGAPDRAPRLGQVNRDLDAVIMRALAKNKDDRYGSMEAFADDLTRYLRGESVYARTYGQFARTLRFLKRHWLAAVASAAVIATLLFATIATGLALRTANVERDRASRAAAVAFNMFDMAVNEVDESLRPLSGGARARNRLMDRISVELDSLESLVRDNPALELLRVDTLTRRADVVQTSGDVSTSHRMFGAAIGELFRRSTSELSPEFVHRALILHRKSAATAGTAARHWFEQGAEFLESHASTVEDSASCRLEASRLRCAFAHWAVNARNYELASTQAESALNLLRLDESPDANAADWWSQAASALDSLGRSRIALGKGADGIRDLHRAFKIRRLACERRPADSVARRELIRSCIELSRVERGSGNVVEAMYLLEIALEESTLSIRLDPDADGWLVDPIIVCREYAELLVDLNLPEFADHYADRALSMADEMLAADPKGTESLRSLGYARLTRGKVRLAMGSAAGALDEFEAALSIRQTIVASSESPEPGDLLALSAAFGWCGRASARIPDRASAKCYLALAWEYSLKIESLDQSVASAAVESSATELNLAIELMRSENAEDWADARTRLDGVSSRLSQLRERGNLDGLQARIDEIEKKRNECAKKLLRQTTAQ